MAADSARPLPLTEVSGRQSSITHFHERRQNINAQVSEAHRPMGPDQMSTEHVERASLKQKAEHEFWDYAGISLYLAFFFCALSTYSMLLLSKFEISYFTYSIALINALVIAKVILIGEYARLGKKYEAKPLLYSVIYKAVLFTLF